jgi:predicted nucleic acid-binding protein
MRLYLDTNVLVGFLKREERYSGDLILRALNCQYTLVISSWTIAELQRIGFSQESDTLLKFFMHHEKVVYVRHGESDCDAARRITTTHFADAMHYLLAKRSAEGIATWNLHDFPFTDIFVRTPKDL